MLAAIQDAGAAHVAALLTAVPRQRRGDARRARSRLEVADRLPVCASRRRCARPRRAQLTAASAVRALSACRMLAKLHLVHYATVPGRLWHVAYAIHASAEKAGFATTPVHAQSDHRTMTTAEQELLRLLMLRVSAPDMMAPEQIEVADRVVEQLGAEFTLRQPGVADNPFCFEPGSEFAPRRAKGRQPAAAARYFGPGMGYDSLERIAQAGGRGEARRLQGLRQGHRAQGAAEHGAAPAHLLARRLPVCASRARARGRSPAGRAWLRPASGSTSPTSTMARANCRSPTPRP